MELKLTHRPKLYVEPVKMQIPTIPAIPLCQFCNKPHDVGGEEIGGVKIFSCPEVPEDAFISIPSWEEAESKLFHEVSPEKPQGILISIQTHEQALSEMKGFYFMKDGNRIHFTAWDDDSLEEAKEYYKYLTYAGSATECWLNNHFTVLDKETHFFVNRANLSGATGLLFNIST